MKNKLKTNKKAITAQTIFFVLMTIMMVWIIIFGIQKLAQTKDIFDDTKKIEIQNNIKNQLEYCDDPLNRGTQLLIELGATKNYNVLCILGEDQISSNPKFDIPQLGEIAQTNDNIILARTKFIQESSDIYYDDKDFNIVFSFNAQINKIPQTSCWDNSETGNKIEISLTC